MLFDKARDGNDRLLICWKIATDSRSHGKIIWILKATTGSMGTDWLVNAIEGCINSLVPCIYVFWDLERAGVFRHRDAHTALIPTHLYSDCIAEHFSPSSRTETDSVCKIRTGISDLRRDILWCIQVMIGERSNWHACLSVCNVGGYTFKPSWNWNLKRKWPGQVDTAYCWQQALFCQTQAWWWPHHHWT